MAILILGASGTVGGATARALARLGAGPVRCLVRDPARADGLAGLGLEVAIGDLDDPPSLDRALAGADRMLLVAPLGPDLERREAAAIAAASRAGVRHVVKLSTLGVAEAGPGHEPRPYPAHRAGERRLERSGMAWTHLRPGPFFQNLLAQAPAIRAAGAITAAWGEGRQAFVDARDVADVAARALADDGHEGRAYALTGPAALSGRELAAGLSAGLGRPVGYADAPPEAVAAALRARGMPEWLVGALQEVMARVRAGAPAPVGDGVEQVCGRRPRSVEEFARDHAEAFGVALAGASGRSGDG
ncbi:MAG: hypothetical protein QOD86_1522 [Miltoncostaeaceae bacterium]|jgi:uncharacterized protein YbjT (DUF2867 family)|nr:hypothetical protein [Miltoncostaeaceae bacterium]